MRTARRLRIVFGNGFLARYQQGGGLWSLTLQYLLGLRALGHEVLLLELLWSTADPGRDERSIASFFARLREYGLDRDCALLLFERDAPCDPRCATAHGRSMVETMDAIAGADLLWNDCGGVREPLLSMFARRVMIDMDPGHLQVAAAAGEPDDLYSNHVFVTIGGRVGDPGCDVPTLGLAWKRFLPFVYLPMWTATPDPGADAPITSVTHWTWGGQLPWQGRLVSTSKRDAYLRYVTLPGRVGRSFELAANIRPDDATGDRELLEGNGWSLVDPWEVAGSPAQYQRYLARSRAELSCAKPVFTELATGWISDRSVSYLASGRPVIAEDTGLDGVVPTGEGLLVFRDLPEAVEATKEIDADYARHSAAARALAEELFDSGRSLRTILDACGA